jgi:hypothetical protein
MSSADMKNADRFRSTSMGMDAFPDSVVFFKII